MNQLEEDSAVSATSAHETYPLSVSFSTYAMLWDKKNLPDVEISLQLTLFRNYTHFVVKRTSFYTHPINHHQMLSIANGLAMPFCAFSAKRRLQKIMTAFFIFRNLLLRFFMGAGNFSCQFSKVGLCLSRLPSTQKIGLLPSKLGVKWVCTAKY